MYRYVMMQFYVQLFFWFFQPAFSNFFLIPDDMYSFVKVLQQFGELQDLNNNFIDLRLE